MRPDPVSGKVSLVTSLEKVDRGKTKTPVTAYKYKKLGIVRSKQNFPIFRGGHNILGISYLHLLSHLFP